MRNAAYVSALILIVIHSLCLHQVYKFPMLFIHFFEHQQRDNKISVLDFLSMHYWGQDLNDNDQDRDNQLPFKKADSNMSHFSSFLHSTGITISPFIGHPVKFNNTYKSVFSNENLTAPFRPPKIV